MNKMRIGLIALLALSLSCSAFAAATNYVGGGGPWGVDGNWTAGTPTLTLDANFYGQSGTIESGTNALARNIYLALNNNANVTLTMNAGSLTTAQQLNIAQSANTTANFTVKSGLVDVGTNMMVGLRGQGSLDVHAGATVDINTMLQVGHTNNGGTGSATIAGTLIARANNNINVTSLAIQNGGNLDITGSGKLLVFGNKMGSLGNLLNGRLTGNGLSSNIVMETVTFDNATYTQVTAIPEPATIALMAFGLAGVIRRRK